MQVAIITTPREPVYVLDTIKQVQAGLAQGDTLEVFSDDPLHFLDYEERRHVAHRHMPLSLWTIAKERKRFERATLNFLSALKHGTGDIVLFEDDVEVKPDWRFYLQGVIDESKASMVSMYWPDAKPFADSQHAHGYSWYEYARPVTFHGSLGLWLSASARSDLAWYIDLGVRAIAESAEQVYLAPFDNTVAAFLRVPSEPAHRLVATLPALVDHRGVVSAIPENASHGLRKSPGF